MLEQENEQLKKELEACKNAPFSKLVDHIENQEYSETPAYSRKEFHEMVLPKIKAKSEEKYKKALEIIQKTDYFSVFCDSLITEMMDRSGGFDTLKNQPIGCRDKSIGNKVLLEEGKGKILRAKMSVLVEDLSGRVHDNPYYAERVTLDHTVIDFSAEKYDTWEEYRFKNMPLCALIPIISSFKSKAQESEIAVLQYLNE